MKGLVFKRPQNLTYHDKQGRFRIKQPTGSIGLGWKLIRR